MEQGMVDIKIQHFPVIFYYPSWFRGVSMQESTIDWNQNNVLF